MTNLRAWLRVTACPLSDRVARIRRRLCDREFDTCVAAVRVPRGKTRLDATHAAIHAKNQYATLLGSDSDARGRVPWIYENDHCDSALDISLRSISSLPTSLALPVCACTRVREHTTLFRELDTAADTHGFGFRGHAKGLAMRTVHVHGLWLTA